ncbi:transposase [Niveibacterium sp.]|uniref:transposase n=1 Tax=Niveibacterium sp. TaxID=2017444 RepID=UPI0035B0BE13
MTMRSLYTQVSWPRGRRPKRADLLDRLHAAMPWAELIALVEPHYPKPSSGRPPHPLPVMVRIRVLQWAFRLSDAAVEDLILDSHAAARFVGIDPWSPRPPGASSIQRFRSIVDDVLGARFWALVFMGIEVGSTEFRQGAIREPVLRLRRAKTSKSV